MKVEVETMSNRRWLTPGVRGIGLASLLADLGHEVPTSLLPSFLTSTLRAPASALGLIEGIADGLAGAARLVGGALADEPDRRRSVAVGGYATTAVLSGLIGVAGSVWEVAADRVSDCQPWFRREPPPPGENLLVPIERFGREQRVEGEQLASDWMWLGDQEEGMETAPR